MQVTSAKIVSAVIAMAYAIGMAFSQGGITPAVLKLWLVLPLPLALIWFPDEIGGFTGYVGRGGNVTTETPGTLISAAGWFFLVGFPVLLYLLLKR